MLHIDISAAKNVICLCTKERMRMNRNGIYLKNVAKSFFKCLATGIMFSNIYKPILILGVKRRKRHERYIQQTKYRHL
jgi:hypothetical protein